MKAPVRTTIIVCLLAGVSGVPVNAKETIKAAPGPENPETAVVTEVSGRFGFDLYRQLAKENPGGNLFFSPWSVFGALTMTVEGAREETAVEMGTVMGFPGTLRQTGDEGRLVPWRTAPVHIGVAAVNKGLGGAEEDAATKEIRARIAALRAKCEAARKNTEDLQGEEEWEKAREAAMNERKLVDELNGLLAQVDQYEIRVANALWGEKSYPFRQEYLDTIARHHDTGGAFMVDFKNAFEDGRRKINGWAEEQTRGRIKGLIPAGGLDKWTRLVLTNAIYFKGEWSTPFKEGETKERGFTLGGGTVKQVSTMSARSLKGARYAAFHADGSFFQTPKRVSTTSKPKPGTLYPGADGFAMVELPYKGGALSMVVIAPNDPQGLAALEAKLTPESLTGWIGKLEKRETHVQLPKFKLETKYTLGDSEKPGALQQMGMVRAFIDPLDRQRGARFGGMTTSTDPMKQLYIAKVFHKAFVEVNEKGTEAAAATAVAMPVPMSLPMDRPFTPEFKAERPFVFLIRDTSSGAILFLGRVSDPAG